MRASAPSETRTIRVALLHVLGLPLTRLRDVAVVANTEWVELRAAKNVWTVIRGGETATLETSA